MILSTVNSLIHVFFTWGVSRICEWISTRMTCKFTKNRAIINYYNIKSIPFNVISAIWYKLPTDHAYIKSLAFKQTPHGKTQRACSLAIKMLHNEDFLLDFQEYYPCTKTFSQFWQQCVNWSEQKINASCRNAWYTGFYP